MPSTELTIHKVEFIRVKPLWTEAHKELKSFAPYNANAVYFVGSIYNLDIGFVGSYGDGGTSSANHYHVSFARDASQNKWKLLSKSPAPVNNVFDYTDPAIEFGVLQIAALEVSSSVTVTNFNADMLDGYHQSYFLPAETASVVYLTQSVASATYATQQEFNNLKIAVIMGIY